MMSMRRTQSVCGGLLVLLVAGLLAGCGSNNAGSQVKPGELKASSALGGGCSDLGTATPLIVDMPDRSIIEGAMQDGVVFVNYDCNTLTILEDCRLSGEYTYSGLSRSEELVSLENNDEVSGNLLFTGGSGSAELDSGNALHIGMVKVGRKSTAARVARDQLEGGQCPKATHYVRQAVVGAFAMKTAQRGSVSGAVDVFAVGGGQAASNSSSGRDTRDGELDACKSSKSTDETPIEQCQALLRLSLSPIPESLPPSKGEAKAEPKKGDEKAEEKEEVDETKDVVGEAEVCPKGMSFYQGKCAAESADIPTVCEPTNSDQCLQSCKAGNLQSCQFYGILLYGNLCKDPAKQAHCDEVTADGQDAALEADEKASLEFFRKGCEAGMADSCAWIGDVSSSYWEDDAALRKEGVAAYDKACGLGNGEACYSIGDYRLDGSEGVEKDEFQGVADYHRACKLGELGACQELGGFYFTGEHVTQDPARGLQFMRQFCEQGDATTCYELGQHLLGSFNDNDLGDPIKPANIPDAEKTGREMLDRGCKLKDEFSCYELGRVLFQAKEFDQAKLYLEAAIAAGEGDSDDSEIILGNMYFNGNGVAANKAQAIDYWVKSEDEDLLLKAATMLEKGDGVIKDTERAGVVLGEYCYSSEEKKQCMKVKTLNPKAFTDVMGRLCEAETAWACDEYAKDSPLEHKNLLRRQCEKYDNDPEDFNCKRLKSME
jgi:TPR repeat protein